LCLSSTHTRTRHYFFHSFFHSFYPPSTIHHPAIARSSRQSASTHTDSHSIRPPSTINHHQPHHSILHNHPSVPFADVSLCDHLSFAYSGTKTRLFLSFSVPSPSFRFLRPEKRRDEGVCFRFRRWLGRRAERDRGREERYIRSYSWLKHHHY
jgi:hypothetical protein